MKERARDNREHRPDLPVSCTIFPATTLKAHQSVRCGAGSGAHPWSGTVPIPASWKARMEIIFRFGSPPDKKIRGGSGFFCKIIEGVCSGQKKYFGGVGAGNFFNLWGVRFFLKNNWGVPDFSGCWFRRDSPIQWGGRTQFFQKTGGWQI